METHSSPQRTSWSCSTSPILLTDEDKTIEVYPDAISKAVALGYALIKWHSFLDGNKRTGVFCMAYMLEKNGVEMAFPPYIVKYLF